MRTKDGFTLRRVLGEAVILAEGSKLVNFNKMISLNETAAFLWESVCGKEFDEDMRVALLLENYEIDEETARRDVQDLLSKWDSIGLIG